VKNYCTNGGQAEFYCFARLTGIPEDTCEFYEDVEERNFCIGHYRDLQHSDIPTVYLLACHSRKAIADSILLKKMEDI